MTYIDRRFDPPRCYQQPPSEGEMRVPQELLRCVGFVGSHDGGKNFAARGTCFVVSVPIAGWPAKVRHYAITCRHVTTQIGALIGLRFNRKGSGTRVVEIDTGKDEFFVVDEVSRDVIAIPIDMPSDIDWRGGLSLQWFLAAHPEETRNPICIGDEVFMIGLFSELRSECDRNEPIARRGTVARLGGSPVLIEGVPRRDEEVPTEAYLIDGMALGGMSGAPVYARRGYRLRGHGGEEDGNAPMAQEAMPHLLGMLNAHWNIKGSALQRLPSGQAEIRQYVNTGVAAITPSHLIAAMVCNPIADEERQKWARDTFGPAPATPD
jgi:hypothetical protein